MARFSFDIPRELQEQLKKCANIDGIAPKMIAEAEPLVVDSVKKVLKDKGHDVTGDLIKSVIAEKPKKNSAGGWYGRVSFKGYGKHKYKNKTQDVPNSQKAMALEYGTKRGQRATPFIDASVKAVNDKVIDKMQEVYNREALRE